MKTFFNEFSKAKKIASSLNREDTGWTYKVIKLENSKFSVVLIYDEDGIYVGML